MTEFAMRSSWGMIDITATTVWAAVIAVGYALIILAAWAIVRGGTSKPTPPFEQSKPEALRATGEDFDRVWRGGWRT